MKYPTVVAVILLLVSDYFAVKDALQQTRIVPIVGVELANEDALAASVSKPSRGRRFALLAG